MATDFYQNKVDIVFEYSIYEMYLLIEEVIPQLVNLVKLFSSKFATLSPG